MLVVHPKDITTSVLTSLYKGTDSKVVDQTASKREIEHLLHHCPPHERIMLLGHGSDNGLFSRTDDNVLEFEMKGGEVMIVKYFVKKDNDGNDINSWYYETWKKVKMPPVYPKDLVR